jgi:hypothetical protein
MNLEENSTVVEEDTEMASEYDFSGAVQGKHFRAYRQGYTVTIHKEDGNQEIREYQPKPVAIVLDADVARVFPDSEAVNAALRFLIRAVHKGNLLLRESPDESYQSSLAETPPDSEE